jgi:predicted DNA-binding transcriptional regulator YafY
MAERSRSNQENFELSEDEVSPEHLDSQVQKAQEQLMSLKRQQEVIERQKRELEEYRRHIQRVKNQRPLIDTTTPHSLGLKHLATRPKKQQLIEDRRQSVANENAKLMERMAKIMSSHTEDEKFVRMAGRNEAFRRRDIDRINAENRAIVEHVTDGDELVLKLVSIDQEWLIRTIIGFGGRIKVLQPVELADHVRARAAAIRENY